MIERPSDLPAIKSDLPAIKADLTGACSVVDLHPSEWNGAGAVQWAVDNAFNDGTDLTTSAVMKADNCTNFVSWALFLGGGLPMTRTGETRR